MGNAISTAFQAISTAISAVELANWLEQQPGSISRATTSTTVAAHQAQELHSGIRSLLLFASATGFTASVAFIFINNRLLLHRGGGGGNRRVPEMVLYVCAGLLQFLLFVQAPAGGDPDGQAAAARALGLAALRALPAAATVTFFLGALLIVAAHIRAGGEGGGGVVVVAGEEPVQAQAPPLVGLLRLLSTMAVAATEGLLCLMAIAVYGAYY